MTLPTSVLNLVEFAPAEDLFLKILRDGMPDIPFVTLINQHQPFPCVLVRRAPDLIGWQGDPRFIDSAAILIHTFTNGDNADQDGALLSEAVRVTIRNGINKVVPGMGHLVRADLHASPRRVTDWGTATGPVQYADLPQGVTRYESIYTVLIKRPAQVQLP